ncbi:hypothetical protein L596_027687 [Steinernema carpocapsae]|uniref:ATP-dependent RNA helicase n=1 Tax=Steinernema carpocapsae TaxID=34508 RepID=A0A4U5LW94_STECR|nr:hypothetical protein L596_027687 [Steinernema carpocapsae]
MDLDKIQQRPYSDDSSSEDEESFGEAEIGFEDEETQATTRHRPEEAPGPSGRFAGFMDPIMNDRIDEEDIPNMITGAATASSRLTFPDIPKPSQPKIPKFQTSLEERSRTPVPEERRAKPGALFELLTDVSRIEIREYKSGEAVETKAEFIHGFDGYPFHPRLIENLRDIGCRQPTAVQKAYWNLALTKITHVMVQSQTGSGKTFAYLVPMIQRVIALKEMFARMQREGNKSVSKKKNAPLVIIFVPTRELVTQVAENAELLTRNIPEVSITSSKDRGPLTKGSDIHVTTMGGMMKFIETTERRPYRRIELTGCLFTVFDEADKFFHDHDTEEQTKQVVGEIFDGKENMRISAFSATMTGNIEAFMDGNHFDVYDKNQIPVSIDHKVIILEPREAKTAVLNLMDHVTKENGGMCPKVLIFANRRVLCDILAFHLTTHGYSAMSFSSKWPQLVRTRATKSFVTGDLNVLVASDVLAPGVDWNVDVIINYQLPPKHQFSRFKHRIGRTGRAGNTGKVFSFFYNGYGLHEQIDPDHFAAFLKELNFDVPDHLQAYYDLYCAPGAPQAAGMGIEMGYDDSDLENGNNSD